MSGFMYGQNLPLKVAEQIDYCSRIILLQELIRLVKQPSLVVNRLRISLLCHWLL